MSRPVIGVDPASGRKGSYVFAPKVPEFHDRYLQPREIGQLVAYAKECDALVCWDAPLTAAPEKWFDTTDEWKTSSFLTQRPIERVTVWDNTVRDENHNNPFHAPGVSMLGYAGLPHWTITQAALGLPVIPSVVPKRESPADPVLPLVTSDERPAGAAVVEVHPTVAAWLWVSEDKQWPDCQYKGRQRGKPLSAKQAACAVKDMWSWLTNQAGKARAWPMNEPLADSSCPDAFDARIAWLLGTLWCGPGQHGGLLGEVQFVGNATIGGFLLPTSRLDASKVAAAATQEQPTKPGEV